MFLSSDCCQRGIFTIWCCCIEVELWMFIGKVCKWIRRCRVVHFVFWKRPGWNCAVCHLVLLPALERSKGERWFDCEVYKITIQKYKKKDSYILIRRAIFQRKCKNNPPEKEIKYQCLVAMFDGNLQESENSDWKKKSTDLVLGLFGGRKGIFDRKSDKSTTRIKRCGCVWHKVSQGMKNMKVRKL